MTESEKKKVDAECVCMRMLLSTTGFFYDAVGVFWTSMLSGTCIFLGYFLLYCISNGWFYVPAYVAGIFLFLVGQVGLVVSADLPWGTKHTKMMVGWFITPPP